jgi:diacylglycerol O-acyltransferase
VNDIVLAACALGFRALIQSRSAVGHDDVMTLMPLSTRSIDARGVLDNRVAVTHALLPVDTDDPVRVLSRLRVHLAEVKASHQHAASTPPPTSPLALTPILREN